MQKIRLRLKPSINNYFLLKGSKIFAQIKQNNGLSRPLFGIVAISITF